MICDIKSLNKVFFNAIKNGNSVRYKVVIQVRVEYRMIKTSQLNIFKDKSSN